MSQRLVLFGEGDGDRQALPILLSKVLGHLRQQDAFFYGEPFAVGSVNSLVTRKRDSAALVCDRWVNFLRAAAKQRPFGILVVLDGDVGFPSGGKSPLCAANVARQLAGVAVREAGAGKSFSLAIVFACKEYESWLAAGVESLSGKAMPDGRIGVRPGTVLGESKPEQCGKRWLQDRMACTYRQTMHQSALTRHLDVSLILERKIRSFNRFCHAVEQLCNAAKTGEHTCTPT